MESPHFIPSICYLQLGSSNQHNMVAKTHLIFYSNIFFTGCLVHVKWGTVSIIISHVFHNSFLQCSNNCLHMFEVFVLGNVATRTTAMAEVWKHINKKLSYPIVINSFSISCYNLLFSIIVMLQSFINRMQTNYS